MVATVILSKWWRQ